MEFEQQNQTSSISYIKSIPGHFKFRYKYESQSKKQNSNATKNSESQKGSNASQSKKQNLNATKNSDKKGQKFDAELNVELTTNVHHKIFIALVAYYKYFEVQINQSEASNQESKKPNSQSKKRNDLIASAPAKAFWKQEIYEKYSTESDEVEEENSDDEVSRNDISNKTKVEHNKKEEAKSLVIDLADLKSRQQNSSNINSKFANIKSQPAPKNIQGRGTKEEYFWTHHGNELEGFKEKLYEDVNYEVKVIAEHGLIILDIIIIAPLLAQYLVKKTLYLKNLSLSQANIKQKSKKVRNDDDDADADDVVPTQIEQDTTQFSSNIGNRLNSPWSISIKPNPFNNSMIK